MGATGRGTDHDEEGPDAPQDSATSARSAPSDWLRRVLSGRSKSTTPPPDTPRGKRRAMERLDRRERRYSFAAALAAAAFAVIIYATETRSHTFHLAKGQLTPQTTLILGLGAAALLALGTYSGRRAPVAFVCLFTFFIFSNGAGIIAGLPFIGLGGWLLYRSFQMQRRAKAPGGDTARPRSEARRNPAPSRSAPAPKKTDRAKGPARPTANKRYTPKRPPPSAAKPSRRQRKAAEAKE